MECANYNCGKQNKAISHILLLVSSLACDTTLVEAR